MGSELLRNGITLMLVGMGTVFIFLTLLVGATALMSGIVTSAIRRSAHRVASAEEIAAITAAIARHRNLHGARQARQGS